MSMIDKNPQALALAFKKCKGKRLKIKDLDIKPGMAAKRIEKLIEDLSTAKAIDKSLPMSEVVAGQRWYVEGLVKFSGLTIEEQLDAEYEDSFADNASEAEMLQALHAM
jgi:hypothetical protein